MKDLKINIKERLLGGNYFCEYLRSSQGWIIWDKENGKSNFADCELIWTSFDKATRLYKYLWNGMLQKNMGKRREKRKHPTQKPIELIMKILLEYGETKENDLILDCFLGSGTIAVACEKLGRRWIGIEIGDKYCEIAKQRIEQEANQIKMDFK